MISVNPGTQGPTASILFKLNPIHHSNSSDKFYETSKRSLPPRELCFLPMFTWQYFKDEAFWKRELGTPVCSKEGIRKTIEFGAGTTWRLFAAHDALVAATFLFIFYDVFWSMASTCYVALFSFRVSTTPRGKSADAE